MKTNYKRILKYEYFGAGVILFLIFVFDLYPKIAEVFILKNKIHFAKVSVKSISEAEIVRERQNLKKELGASSQDLAFAKEGVQAFRNKTVSEENIALITLSIEEIATKAGVELNYVRPLESRQVDNFKLMPINIGCQGSFEKMMAFIVEVENTETKMIVKRLSMKGEDIISLELTIEVALQAGAADESV